MSRDFQIFAPLSFFEKADAPKGERKRIAGIVSTETVDKQGERLLQQGLDFSPFVKHGWFNDNHAKGATDVLGYPDKDVRKFAKGEKLPDGSIAPANCTWAEGHLVDTPKANGIWELGVALQKAGSHRRLGFSIEGQVLQRAGSGGKTVAKALVRHVAITHVPVGEDTRLEVLAKSLAEVEKGISMTPSPVAPGANPSTAGSVSGAGAGVILTPKHLEEGEPHNLMESVEDDEDAEEVSKSSAMAAIQDRMGCDRETAERAYGVLLNLKRRGRLS